MPEAVTGLRGGSPDLGGFLRSADLPGSEGPRATGPSSISTKSVLRNEIVIAAAARD
jgi:hypothetical protein